MSRHAHDRPRWLRAAPVWLAALGAVVFAGGHGLADDRDLLRFAAGKPYLFLLLDSSASMGLKFGAGDLHVPGYADNPASRLASAREAVFDVFEDVGDVQFGFASFLNQDHLAVKQVHHLYYVDAIPTDPQPWPITEFPWPTVDTTCGADPTKSCLVVLEDKDGDMVKETYTADLGGDVLVFGPAFDPAAVNGVSGSFQGWSPPPPMTLNANGDPLVGGCVAGANAGSQPALDLGTALGRNRLNAFARPATENDSMGNGKVTTTIWVKRTSPLRMFQLTFKRLGNTKTIGQDGMIVRFGLTEYDPSTCNPKSGGLAAASNFVMRRDDHLNRFVMMDRGIPGQSSGQTSTERTAALWNQRDADDDARCSDTHPFQGKGWEGNYDSGGTLPNNQECDPSDVDNDGDKLSCPDTDRVSLDGSLKPMEDTALSTFGRALDRGDMLPFDWNTSATNKEEILRRMAPNWLAPLNPSPPNFSQTFHLAETADPTTGTFPPLNEGRETLIARGDTGLAKAMNDFRCWYMGRLGRPQAAGKCNQSPFWVDGGWSDLACEEDSSWGCRKPYLVIISDGDEVCGGEDPTADLSDMKNFSGVKVWGLNVGDPRGCSNVGGLHSIVTAAGGECINVANKEELKDILEKILGVIREQAQSFASAAVPSVQATADQAIYISTFTPLRNKSVWDGHLNAFLKPLPLDADGKPDTSAAAACSDTNTSRCHLWDAGIVTRDEQVPASGEKIGLSLTQRFVTYGQLRSNLAPADPATWNQVPWPMAEVELAAGGCADCKDLSTAGNNSCLACRDLVRALGIAMTVGDPVSVQAAEDEARAVLAETFDVDSHTITLPDGTPGPTITRVLGDIFHANPVVVGTPRNVPYFALDLGADQGEDCALDDSVGGGQVDRGYRCFVTRHRFRRKLVLVGSNDGMLHAFNAGAFRRAIPPPPGRYDNGTGNEVWAYMPRSVMPVVKELAQGEVHQFAVDGTPTVADVFIDPIHDGVHSSTEPPTAEDRLWRTVVIGGLREGGSKVPGFELRRGAYYALDVTQPDLLELHSGQIFPKDVPNYLATCASAPGTSIPNGCGLNPYPAVLWEFFDHLIDSIAVNPSSLGLSDLRLHMDEDLNFVPDLGETWSTPNVGRIRLCRTGGTKCNPADPTNDDDLEDRYVAVFAGGDAGSDEPLRGDWLYMVDIETGKVIYKRQLLRPNGQRGAGGSPGTPAPVDTDVDGYFDRIYLGTTGGFIYRVDLALDSDGNVPQLASANAQALGGPTVAVYRVPERDANLEPLWEPRLIFDANFDKDSNGVVKASTFDRPIFHRPSVVFVARRGKFGLAFGTGNREDLWAANSQEGRFYVFVDDTDELDPADLPLDEGDLRRVLVSDTDLSEDLLLVERGWFLVLDPDERVITDSFSLSGVTSFSSFQPDIALADSEDCDPIADPSCELTDFDPCGEAAQSDTDNLCAKTGISRIFVVGTVNANQFLEDASGNPTRFHVINAFVTNPFTEPGLASNAGDPSGSGGSTTDSDTLSPTEERVMHALERLFPEGCKFANYRVDIKTIAADTRVQRIAAIPQCIMTKNWKEF